MDTSNPVVSSDRKTIEQVREQMMSRRRQDLNYLRLVAGNSQRVLLHVGDVLPEDEVRSIVKKFVEAIPKVDSTKDGELPDDVFRTVKETMPVCGIVDSQGVPLHPPSVNNSEGKVCVRRIMGGVPGAPMGLNHIVEVLGDQVLNCKKVYTSGTWKGFLNRMRKQMSRRTSPMVDLLAVNGKTPNRKTAYKYLDTILPRKKVGWPGLGEDIFDTLLGGIKITANASAGAPYWRNKGECITDILQVGLPIVVEAIRTGRLDDLYRENPEFFLCEVKNKLDRYDKGKLEEKTRPYTCVPAHWAFLFSILTQGFQEGLSLFDTNDKSSNAYGFSSSKGGLRRMYEWMLRADKRGRVCVYGDDACIVVRKGKEVWRVDPDFQQMDGSLNLHDICTTIGWVMEHLAAESEDGKVPVFWREVANVWLMMATNPPMIVDGKKIYKKYSDHGLMTGVPGTTLFDTVKAAVFWNKYLDHCFLEGLDPLREDLAHEFAKCAGLVIKEGTWSPARVPEAKPGVLLTDHKFLGVQMLCEEYKGETVIVPTIPLEEAVEMLVVQKDNPFIKRESETMRQRTLFDRMRGLMITFGFTIPQITEAIHNVVNKMDPAVVLMATQEPNGAKPDHITMQDFEWPDSNGFPTREFCLSVYSESGSDKTLWQPIYPNLRPVLDSMRAEVRTMKPRVETRDVEIQAFVGGEYEKQKVLTFVENDDVLETPSIMTNTWPSEKSAKAEYGAEYGERSKIKSVDGKERKYLPPLPISLVLFLGEGVSTVREVRERFGCSPHALMKASTKVGVFMTGLLDDDLMSNFPIQTPAPTLQDEIIENVESRDVVDRYTSNRTTFKRVVQKDVVIQTKPEAVYMDLEALQQFDPIDNSLYENQRDLLEGINTYFQAQGYAIKWQTGEVEPKATNPVPVTLLLKSQLTGAQNWYPIAKAKAPSSKLAKAYLARAILENRGAVVSETPRTLRAHKATTSWAEEVEEAYRPSRDEPEVKSLHKDEETSVKTAAYERLLEILPGENPDHIHFLVANMKFSKFDTERKIILETVDLLKKFEIMRSESSETNSSQDSLTKVSKRSKLSPERRRKQNRKLLEKRKKLRALQNSQSP